MNNKKVNIKDILIIWSLLFRKQFFSDNKVIFLLIPLIISFFLSFTIDIKVLFNDDTSSELLVIISIIWWILLNFLALILSDEKSLLYKEWTKEIYWELIFEKNEDSSGNKSSLKIDYFTYLYNKLFFIIFLTIIYVLFFLFLKFWLFSFLYDEISCLIKNIIFLSYLNFIFKFLYIYWIIFYFINLIYTLFFVYFLLQRE